MHFSPWTWDNANLKTFASLCPKKKNKNENEKKKKKKKKKTHKSLHLLTIEANIFCDEKSTAIYFCRESFVVPHGILTHAESMNFDGK